MYYNHQTKLVQDSSFVEFGLDTPFLFKAKFYKGSITVTQEKLYINQTWQYPLIQFRDSYISYNEIEQFNSQLQKAILLMEVLNGRTGTKSSKPIDF
jgi:hypothetical protein